MINIIEWWRRGGTPYKVLYWEAWPKRGTFSRLQVVRTPGISWGEVYEWVEKSFLSSPWDDESSVRGYINFFFHSWWCDVYSCIEMSNKTESYLNFRDVDNSREPGKLPGCQCDFSSWKMLQFLKRQLFSSDITRPSK